MITTIRIKFWVIFSILLLFFISGCGTKRAKQTVSVEKDSTSVENVPVKEIVKPIQYTQFLLGKSGNVSDSFPHNTSWIRYLDIGKKQKFPHGFAALQQTLNDTILNGCELKCVICEEYFHSENFDTNYCKKEGVAIEQFRPTDGESYFNSINYLNYYFFLMKVDSNLLSMDDTEKGFLHFLKMKTKRNKLESTVKVLEEDYVNMVANENVIWKKPIPVFMLDKNKKFESSFNKWQEIWDCGQKADYSPNYPWVDFISVKGIFKRYSDYGSPINTLEDPYFVFSYILLNESKNELKNVQSRVYPMQLVTIKGEIRKGTGIDLNSDKHADVFWYNRVYLRANPVQKRNTVLYIKIGKEWTPVYINNFSEFY